MDPDMMFKDVIARFRISTKIMDYAQESSWERAYMSMCGEQNVFDVTRLALPDAFCVHIDEVFYSFDWYSTIPSFQFACFPYRFSVVRAFYDYNGCAMLTLGRGDIITLDDWQEFAFDDIEQEDVRVTVQAQSLFSIPLDIQFNGSQFVSDVVRQLSAIADSAASTMAPKLREFRKILVSVVVSLLQLSTHSTIETFVLQLIHVANACGYSMEVPVVLASISSLFNVYPNRHMPLAQVGSDGIGLLVLTAILFVLSQVMGGKMLPLSTMIVQFPELVGRKIIGITGLVGFVVRIIEACYYTVQSWLTGVDVSILKCRDLPELQTWVSTARDLVDILNVDKGRVETEKVDQLLDILNRGYELEKFLVKTSVPNIVKTSFQKILMEVRHLLVELKGNAFVDAPRVPPFVVWMYGDTSVGKSTLANYMAVDFVRLLKPHLHTEEQISPCIYVRTPDNKFWDSYTHRKVVTVYDDFGAIHPHPSRGAEEVGELIKTVNMMSYPLHMADVASKGNVRFVSDVMLMTSNVSAPDVTLMTCPDAVLRRRNVVLEVRVHRKYQKTFGSSVILDVEKIRSDLGSGMQTGIYEFVIRSTDSDEVQIWEERACHNYEQIRRFLFSKLLEHKDHGSGLVKSVFSDLESRTFDDFQPSSCRLRSVSHQVIPRAGIGGALKDAVIGPKIVAQSGEDQELQVNEPLTDEQIMRYWPEALPQPSRVVLALKRAWNAVTTKVRNSPYTTVLKWWMDVYGARVFVAGLGFGAIIANFKMFMHLRKPVPDDDEDDYPCPFEAQSPYAEDRRNEVHVSSISAQAGQEENRVHRSLCEFVVPGKNMRCCALGVVGNIVMVPKHALAIARICGMFKICYKGKEQVFEYGNVKCVIFRECDVAFVQLTGLKGIIFKNITQSFVPLKFIKDVDAFGVFSADVTSELIVQNHSKVTVIPIKAEILDQEVHYLEAKTQTVYKVVRGVKYEADTRFGYCGGPVVAYKGKQMYVVAIHVAGLANATVNNCGYGAFVSMEDVRVALTHFEMEQKQMEHTCKWCYYDKETSALCCILEQVRNMMLNQAQEQRVVDQCKASVKYVQFIDNPLKDFSSSFIATAQGGYSTFPDAKYVGPVSKHLQVHQPDRTRLQPSSLKDRVRVSEMGPAVLNKKHVDGILRDPMIIGLQQVVDRCGLDNKEWRFAVDDLVKDLQKVAEVPNFDMLTEFEAINGKPGNEFIDAINMSSSPGWPLVQQTHKRKPELFEGYLPTAVAGKEIRDEIDVLYCQYTHNKPYAWWSATLKDELRPLEKIKLAKTRVFAAAPLAFTLVHRQHFLSFSSWYMRNRMECEHAIGIDVYSKEWNELALRLQKFPNHIALDFSGFDKTITSEMLMYVWEVISQLLKENGCDESRLRIMRWLFTQVAYPQYIIRNVKWSFSRTHPSGEPLTTVVNSILVSLLYRVSFYRHVEHPVHGMFHENVVLYSYGDDNIASVSKACADNFNGITFQQDMRSLGMIVTPASKIGNVDRFQKFEDLTFLSRRFRYSHDHGGFVGPRDAGRILELTNWYRTGGIQRAEAEQMNLDTCLFELHFLGPEVFDEWVTRIRRVIHEARFERIRLRVNLDYGDCLALWVNRYVDDLPSARKTVLTFRNTALLTM